MQPLAAILPSLLEGLGLARGAEGWRAVEQWSAITGERVAKHSHATAYRDGTLTVEVEGSAWMHELGMLKPALVRKLNQHLGAGVVRDVRLVLARGGSLR